MTHGPLDVVIVNWNAGRQLQQCLDSLARVASLDGVELGTVAVVDNASSDGSADALVAGALPLVVLRNPENRGFGAACNQGAAVCSSGFLLFLNPDTVLRADALRKPLDFLGSTTGSSAAICGVQTVDEHNNIARSCARFPTPGSMVVYALALDRVVPGVFRSYFMSDWDHSGCAFVDHLIGAFYLIRRDVFDRVGGFDERFFVYMEDLDLSRRVALAGGRSFFMADAVVFHKGGGTSDQVRAKRLFFSLRSRLQYAGKHFGLVGAWIVLTVTLLVEPWLRLAHASARGGNAIRETADAYRMLFGGLPELLRNWRQ
ncbi:glycosyltransferase family 2 protein [Niveibacterium sp.]|uniref:glycosyltransferase family 2 protein n=1 Tax=Niveibacterium sp. TaxID=2017444 RepID=UPI0035B01EC4